MVLSLSQRSLLLGQLGQLREYKCKTCMSPFPEEELIDLREKRAEA